MWLVSCFWSVSQCDLLCRYKTSLDTDSAREAMSMTRSSKFGRFSKEARLVPRGGQDHAEETAGLGRIPEGRIGCGSSEGGLCRVVFFGQ